MLKIEAADPVGQGGASSSTTAESTDSLAFGDQAPLPLEVWFPSVGSEICTGTYPTLPLPSGDIESWKIA